MINFRTDGVQFIEALKNVESFDKDPVVFECEISEDILVDWYHNGELVKIGENAKTTSDRFRRTLTLPWCNISDAGTYTVKARYAKSSAELNVKGKCRFRNY